MSQTKEQHLEHRRQYRLRNRDRINQLKKIWCDSNPDRVKAARDKSLPKYRESARLRTKAFRQSESGRKYTIDYDRKYRSIPANRIFCLITGARRRCAIKGMEFEEGLYESLLKSPPEFCPCCDKKLDYSAGVRGRGRDTGRPTGRARRNSPRISNEPNPSGYRNDSPSLDRSDNNKGYTVANTKVICWRCNDLKRNCSSPEELRRIASYLEKLTRSHSNSA